MFHAEIPGLLMFINKYKAALKQPCGTPGLSKAMAQYLKVLTILTTNLAN